MQNWIDPWYHEDNEDGMIVRADNPRPSYSVVRYDGFGPWAWSVKASHGDTGVRIAHFHNKEEASSLAKRLRSEHSSK